ncbi:uncharacterized protein LOC127859356 isoform X2 [Dreissena polymorpha]|uniref:uncharacterized protein LOC127859356 isoform X2 n=1 Tax=Dreissena polymorpha TaxID=45954 RepID=UPI002264B659|nr:uncharacterized protein LOC127859356 isoform X2 [Dreissena polymorpha]
MGRRQKWNVAYSCSSDTCLVSRFYWNIIGTIGLVEASNDSHNDKEILTALTALQTQIKHLEDQSIKANNEIEKANNVAEKLKLEINTLTSKLNTEAVKTRDLETKLISEMAKTKQLEKKVDVLLQADRSQNGRTSLTKRAAVNATKIAFSAYLDKYVQNLGPGHTIQFGQVVLNEGDAYNPYTGIFTVPVSGVYMITAALESLYNHIQWFNILIDGDITSSIAFDPWTYGANSMGTNIVLVRLEKGQSVWVAVDSRHSGEGLQGEPSVRATTFSGLYLFD